MNRKHCNDYTAVSQSIESKKVWRSARRIIEQRKQAMVALPVLVFVAAIYAAMLMEVL